MTSHGSAEPHPRKDRDIIEIATWRPDGFIEVVTPVPDTITSADRLNALMRIGIALATGELQAPGASPEFTLDMKIVTAISAQIMSQLDGEFEVTSHPSRPAPLRAAASILAKAFAVSNHKAGRRSASANWRIERRRSDIAFVMAKHPNAGKSGWLKLLKDEYGVTLNRQTFARDLAALGYGRPAHK